MVSRISFQPSEHGARLTAMSKATENADEQIKARRFYVSYEQFETPMPGNAIQMSGIDRARWTPCPGLGANNREVLQDWLNLDDEVIDSLEEKSFIFDSPPS